MVIGVSELQKKISIFRNLTETVHIIDKKSKQILATVLPKNQIEKENLTQSLGGIFQSYKPKESYTDMEEMIADAYDKEMMEKYGK